MWLKRQIAFIVVLLSVSFAYGQKFLALDKRGKVKRVRFFKGDFIAFKTNSDSLIRGQIQWIKDSSLTVDNQEVFISNIASIQSPKENAGLKLISGLSFIAGVGYFTLDSGNRLINKETPFIQENTVKTAAIFLGVAALVSSISTRKYRIGKKHPIKIIDISID